MLIMKLMFFYLNQNQGLQSMLKPHIIAPLSYTYSYLLLYLGNQTLVPPPPPQHCHWCPELKNTLIADFLVAKATLETVGHGH